MFVKGFANLVQDDGRLHPKFHIQGTVSGRLSSSDPNAQQFPRLATNPDIRKCLVASTGRLYLMMDYSQCIDGDSYIFCNTGIKKLKEIIPGKDKICMMDPQHKNKHRVLNIKVLANKGKAECLRITTNTGRQLILTEEHPVKTKQGFTLAKDLKLNDTLYIENLFGTKSVGRLLINSDEAYIAGLFYGEGHYPKEKSGKRKPTDRSIFFSTGSDREELQPLLDNYFGCEFYGPKILQGVLEVIVIRFSLFIRNIQRRILMKWKSQRGS